MTIEPGWYHAEGDPPGTVRRWNGDAWIGYPIAAPNESGTTPGNIAGVRPFVPYRGQVSLGVMGTLAQVGLILVGLASIFYSVSALQLSGHVTPETIAGISSPPSGVSARYTIAAIMTGLLTFATGVAFVTWFFMAYRNLRLWHRTERKLPWAVFAWIVPFISMVRPVTMMFETIEHSPRPDKAQDVSPIPILVWWILWVFAQFGIVFFPFMGDIEDAPRNLLIGQGLLSLCSAVAAFIAVWIVQLVTDAQETRRHPSPAQRELMRQQEQLSGTRGGASASRFV